MVADDPNPPHVSVLYHEIIAALAPKPSGRYVDGTVGAGGHAWGILNASKPDGQLLGFDLDPQALVIAHQRLSLFPDRVFLVQASYTRIQEEIQKLGWESVDGIIFDLGVSSMQMDSHERGFSFRFDSPLDMRFGATDQTSAADLINKLSEADLADIIWKYGEERFARKIAHFICESRPLSTTFQLAKLTEKAYGKSSSKIHPATRTFQAFRIAVNQELAAIENTLPRAIEILKPGGRMAVISFHSLEDRIAKTIFRRESRDCLCPPEQMICTCKHKATIKEINRKPIEPTIEEKERNPRARSAKLRIIQKL